MLAAQALYLVRSMIPGLKSCGSDAYSKPTMNMDVTAILRFRGI